MDIFCDEVRVLDENVIEVHLGNNLADDACLTINESLIKFIIIKLEQGCDFDKIPCIKGDDCPQACKFINKDLAMSILPKHELEKLSSRKVNLMDDIVACPNHPNVQFVVELEGDTYSSPCCPDKLFCTHCNEEAHDGKNCKYIKFKRKMELMNSENAPAGNV